MASLTTSSISSLSTVLSSPFVNDSVNIAPPPAFSHSCSKTLYKTRILKCENKRNARHVVCSQNFQNVAVVKDVATEEAPSEVFERSIDQTSQTRRLRVLIAGGGIGGLVFALAARNRGMDVTIFERDLTAIRGEGQYRGPIQLQSNALAALEAIDPAVAHEIMENGCVTGDRINGLVDGVSGEWYIKFDTFTPAVERGLPVTRVISRMLLQQILAKAVGSDVIKNSTTVEKFEDCGDKVKVFLTDGEVYEGDVLIGADGIRSQVRDQLIGQSDATYSDYTCYTGIADFVPADIDTVGYRVFLGNKQYFVSSDVGNGKMQWYAFHNEPAGGTDPANRRKERLLSIFGHWCDDVVDLLKFTPEEDILRRDIYDRIPIMEWCKGRVALLGDSAHAMQPNMGQGGCMAIEDSLQLAIDLEKQINLKGVDKIDVSNVLKQYESERRMRVGAIHGMARMAAIMASTYKAYLGEGLGPFSWLTKFRIPHPGRVGGRIVVHYTMPYMLQWVLGGNIEAIEGRAPYCSLEERANPNMKKWMEDNDALEMAANAEWFLLPAGEEMPSKGKVTSNGKSIHLLPSKQGDIVFIGSQSCSPSEGFYDIISLPNMEAKHACIDFTDGGLHVTDLGTTIGTWVTRIDGSSMQCFPGSAVRLHPGDKVKFGEDKDVEFKVKLRSLSARE